MFLGDPKEYLTFWTENYPKAVEQLKLRIGREDLLVQIYVRDLLSLVLKNATTAKKAPDLATLYDMLETKLRALESLGRTKEKFADFLEPLVESCLPENVLRAWGRRRISEGTDDATSQRSLEKLMCFLRHEVESEEMIRVIRKRCCLVCLKVGHLAKRCHSRVRCLICKRRHYPLLCPDLLKEKETNFSSKDRTTDNEQKSTEILLTNLPSEHEIYLKTIMIRLRNRDKEVCVRALLDDGSQRSYIEKNLAAKLFLSPSGREIFSQKLHIERESLQNMDVPKMWDLEVLGITDPIEKKNESLLEEETLAHFKETIRICEDQRYEVALPWLAGHPALYDKNDATESRLRTATKRLINENYFEAYDNVFKQWESEGIMEAVPIDQLAKETHYLPHRPIIKPSSNTTKVRPVFDASFKKPGFASLNECLSVGPSLIHKILPLLLRFRFGTIGVLADVKQAFLQIRLRTEELEQLKSQSIEIMKEGSFELSCWASNDSKEDQDMQMVLGLSWDVVSDELSCKLPSNLDCTQERPVTKRVLLSVINSVYDPIGFTAPALLLPKLLVQEAWKRKIG
ncbi:DUF1758 domain-containing protein [Trichonephila inaurata madagascariensis]|uniref:DUF1758 domain-containing protein n=1 Tax=Trichonephila inaurata madagascariensis TaxID=2747483 RepID=A0A8X6Y897_9ARAC|nr:DUF1758 domain-containing protein [Trichonephila inaurata madagascariensis]